MRKLRTTSSILVTVLLIFAAFTVSAFGETRSATPTYKRINLGSLGFVGHAGERAMAINANGTIVGQAEVDPSSCCSGYPHAALFVRGGNNVDLGTLTGYTGESDALALNNSGAIVGWSTSARGKTEAVLWSRTSHTLLPLFTGEATGINDAGLVVGAASTADGTRGSRVEGRETA